MKKSLIIILSLMLVLLMILGTYLVFNKHNKGEKETSIDNSSKMITSTITMDINPSFEINLNSNNKVVNVKALNDDSKVIINDKDFTDKDIEDTMTIIFSSLKDNNYFSSGNNIVLISIKSNNKDLENIVKENIEMVTTTKNIKTELVILQSDEIKELESIAKENNITTAKAYYINEQIKDDENLKIEDFKDLPINEIKEKVDNYKNEEETTKKEETKKQETTKQQESRTTTTTPKTTYTCTPPSDLKDTEWCNWNNKRPRNCDYYYDEVDTSTVMNAALARIGLSDSYGLYGNYATITPYSGASYCIAIKTVTTTSEYRYTMLWDSHTGEFISETKVAVPTFIWTKDEALKKGLEHYGLDEANCTNCWVVIGTDGEGGDNWYYRFQVNMQMNDGTGYTVDFNAVNGEVRYERKW